MLHCVKKLAFVHGISLEDGQPPVSQGDSFGRTDKRSYLMTSCKGLPDNLLSGPAGCSNDK